ncbi:hypothetical protein AVEN_165135-1 [Araneus ventricosus]|uniref:Uncharacterized protein n=1 Tax=Araneus ventricosus TaxID=182803 RepID=A0A4Y2B8A2_ARAVE|nr:hypothetical protein AVEN_165135-1 [Araneus ventricosus]
MRWQVEFYSSVQDVKKVQLCARTLFVKVFIGVSFPFPSGRDRERECEQHKPTHLNEVRASVVVQQMLAICLNRVRAFRLISLIYNWMRLVDHQLPRCTYTPFAPTRTSHEPSALSRQWTRLRDQG